MAYHTKARFEETTIFVSKEDVYEQCYFHNCKIVFYDGLWEGRFDRVHFNFCHIMSFDYYLEHGDK